MKHRQKIRHGTILISFFLFPAIFYYFSPVLIVEASREGIVNGSFITFAALFTSALFLGRGFCGWACPAAGCQEALFSARYKKVTRGNIVKWLIWIPWIAMIVFFAATAGGYTKIDFLYRTTSGLSIGSVKSLIMYYLILILLIVLPALILGRRSFCHHLCWMAPFMIIGRKVGISASLPALRLTAEPGRCIECNRCSAQCPMSLPVMEMVSSGRMEHIECILCGTCVDVCKTKTISLEWGLPARPQSCFSDTSRE